MFALIAISFCFLTLDSALMGARRESGFAVSEFVVWITHFGSSGWILLPAGLALLGIGAIDWTRLRGRDLALWTNRTQVIWFIFLSVGCSGLTATLLKQAIGRARPTHFEELGIASFQAWSFDYHFASFPSGHATTAAALGTAVTLLYPRLRMVAAAVVLWAAASRFLMQVHYPSDVVAGALLGIWLSYFIAAHFAKARLLFSIDGQGRLVAKRGLFLLDCRLERFIDRKCRALDARLRSDRTTLSTML